MKYALVLLCFLTACNVAHEEDKEAGQALKSWSGKSIILAFSALGRPDQVSKGPKGDLYIWYGKREVSNTSITVGAGGQVDYHPSHDNVSISPCVLKIFTDPKNTILRSSFDGTDLGCQQFSKDINEIEHMHENFLSLHDKPLQTALDILGPPDKEITQKGKMVYQWRNVNEGKTCLIRTAIDKDGIIRDVVMADNKAACVKFSDELTPLAAETAKNKASTQ